MNKLLIVYLLNNNLKKRITNHSKNIQIRNNYKIKKMKIHISLIQINYNNSSNSKINNNKKINKKFNIKIFLNYKIRNNKKFKLSNNYFRRI